MRDFGELLRERYAACGPVSDSECLALAEHYRLLCRWNRVLNLTRVVDLEDAVVRHYCEGLYLADALPAGPLTVADIGSGGGFPGIPFAIRRPESPVVLVESHRRKAVFLREASRSLPNCRVLAQRAECGGFSAGWTVSRAVEYGEVLRVAVDGVALLLGEDDADAALAEAAFAWDPVRRLPWGQRRRLLVGKRTVPRGTTDLGPR